MLSIAPREREGVTISGGYLQKEGDEGKGGGGGEGLTSWHSTCANGVPGPVTVSPGGVAALGSGRGLVLGRARVKGELYLAAHVVAVDDARPPARLGQIRDGASAGAIYAHAYDAIVQCGELAARRWRLQEHRAHSEENGKQRHCTPAQPLPIA